MSIVPLLLMKLPHLILSTTDGSARVICAWLTSVHLNIYWVFKSRPSDKPTYAHINTPISLYMLLINYNNNNAHFLVDSLPSMTMISPARLREIIYIDLHIFERCLDIIIFRATTRSTKTKIYKWLYVHEDRIYRSVITVN